MYTLDRRRNSRACRAYLWAAAALAVFSAGYEALSHGVISWFMVLLAAWPLLGGALPFGLMARLRRPPRPGWLARCLYHSGLAALTVGSCVQGILDIYGTTSDYMPVYWLAGAALLAASLPAWLAGRGRGGA